MFTLTFLILKLNRVLDLNENIYVKQFFCYFLNRIFQAHKEIKGKWIFATNLETEAEMVSNPQVRYHAKKITDVFTKAVTILCSSSPNAISLDELNLARLGRSHFHYGVTRDNFVVSFFSFSLLFSLLNV